MKNLKQIKELYKKYIEAGNDANISQYDTDRYYVGKQCAFGYVLKYYFNFDVDNIDDVEKLYK